MRRGPNPTSPHPIRFVRAGLSTSRIAFVALATIVIGGSAAWSIWLPRRGHVAVDAAAFYSGGLKRFDESLVRLDSSLRSTDVAAMQRDFRISRASFKRVEAFVEYFGSFAARE